MSEKTAVKRVTIRRSLKPALAGLAVAVLGLLFAGIEIYSTVAPKALAVTNNSTVNFQARLETASGAIVPDGNYNVEFKLYDTATVTGVPDQGACTYNVGTPDPDCLWFETYDSTSGPGASDVRVRVANGYLSVQLGSITAFPSTINWNQPLWLSMRIGDTGASPTWDNEMSPRIALAATPYSLGAGQLMNAIGGYQELLKFSSAPTSDLTLTLPGTGTASVGQCLQSASGTTVTNTPLTWGACGANTMQQVYNNSAGASPSIDITSANGAVTIQNDNSNPITGELFGIHDKAVSGLGASLFSIDNNGNVTIGNNTTPSTVTIVGGATASRPGSPTKGQLYFDTSTNSLIQYNGTKWVSAPRTATEIVAASNSTQAEKDAADFVATGTNDGAKINSAISALPAGGGIVYLEEGTYDLGAAASGATSISLPNNTTLAGAGDSTILKFANNVDNATGPYSAITNSDTSTGTNVNIQNLEIDGNSSNQSAGTFYGIYFNGMGSGSGGSAVAGGKVSNVNISKMYSGIGILLGSANNNVITNNSTQENGDSGIVLSGSSNNTLTGNLAQGNTTTGIVLSGSSNNNTVTGNTTQGNTTTGIAVSGSSNETLTGNTTQGNSTGIALSTSSNDTVTGNAIEGNTTHGIGLSGASNNNVSANKIYDNGGATANSGIYLASSSTKNSITTNDITDTSCTSSCYAIDISDSGSTGNYLAANHMLGDGTHPAVIHDSTVSGNTYANQPLTENGDASFRNAVNSTTAFQVQSALGSAVLDVDTSNGRVGINMNNPAYALDVNGDVHLGAADSIIIGSTTVCTISGCAAAGGGSGYIQNTTSASLQTGASFAFRPGSGVVGGYIQANGADALQIWDFGGSNELLSVGDTGNILIKPTSAVQNSFQIQPPGSTTPILSVDTNSKAVGIEMGAPLTALDVTGDINASGNLEVGYTPVCTASGCTPTTGSSSYIQNNTTTQAAANFNIRSAAGSGTGETVAVLQGYGTSGGGYLQNADLLDLQSWNGTSATTLSKFDNNGALGLDVSGSIAGGTELAVGGSTGDFTVDTSGNVVTSGTATINNTTLIQTNSATALQIKNTGGVALLNADTNNLKISLQGNGEVSAPGAAAAANTGGTLSGGQDYYYKVAAVLGSGETVASPETKLSATSFTPISAPGSAPTAALVATGSGNLTNGAYSYEVTYVTANGETTVSSASNTVTVDSSHKQVSLSSIPTGPTGTIARYIYRTISGGSTYYWLTELTDNTTTSYTDNVADGSLGNIPPTSNNARTETNTATITFTAVTGAVNYYVYRGTSPGAEVAYQTASSSPFTDTGSAGTNAYPISYGSTLNVQGALQVTGLGSCGALTTDATGKLACGQNGYRSVNTLEIYGHSYAAGAGATSNSTTWGSDLANMLHAQQNNHGQGGAILSWSQSGTGAVGDGGYAALLQDTPTFTTKAPYTPRPGIGFLYYGGNDLAVLGPTSISSSTGPFQESLKASIARLRSSAVFEESDSSMSFQVGTGSAWSSASNSGTAYFASGTGAKKSTSNGNTYTINVPTDFPGGTLDIGLIAGDPSNSGAGATHTFTVDGNAAGSINTVGMAANGSNPSKMTGLVYRITGLSAGAHTIVGTISSITTATYVDYWEIESNPVRPVVVPLANRAISYSLFAGWPFVPSDSDVTTLNSAITNVTSQFDQYVTTVDTDSVMNKDLSNFSTVDLLHPNDQGHAKIAAAIYQAIAAMPLTSQQMAYLNSQTAYTNYQVVFENSWNSTNGFQIQNNTGSSIFNVDTTNSRVQVYGTSSVDTNFTAMSIPTGVTTPTISAGGSLNTANTYYYEVTAIDSTGGETAVSSEVSKNGLSGGNQTLNFSWTKVTGASGYRIYRSTSSGAETLYDTTITNSYVDSGVGPAPGGSPPSTTTATTTTASSNSNGQLIVGGNGTAAGQVYIGGTIPSASRGISTNSLSSPRSVYVQGRYAYIASYSNGKLIVEDVSNSSAPTVVGSVSTNLTNPVSVYVQGHYAYVVDHATSYLEIYDVSNPASPAWVGHSNSNMNTPNSVYVQGRYAYVASTNNNTLDIFDVSNPAAPVSVAHPTTALNGPISVFVQGRYAYVANLTGNSLVVYDISDPTNPVQKSSTTSNLSLPTSVYVQGSYAYVTNDTTYGLDVFNISNPASAPVLTGSTTTGTNTPFSVFVQGRYAYVANNGGNSIGVYDVSNPSDPRSVGSATGNLNGPYNLFVAGRFVYVASSTNNALVILDMGGAYVQQLQAGGAEIGTLTVDSNATVAGDTNVQGGLAVGGSTELDGNLGVSGYAMFQNQTNSTTSFQVANTAGNDLLQIDTNNSSGAGIVYLGGNTSGFIADIGSVGSSSNNSTLHLADSSAGIQTVTIGSTNSSSATSINSGTGNIALTTNGSSSGVLVKSATNSATALQVQNASSAEVLTLSTVSSNLISNPGAEANNTTGWVATGSGTGHAIAVNSTVADIYHGLYSFLVTTDSNAANGGAQITGFTSSVTPAQYTFSFYAMGGATNGTFSTLSVTITGGSAPACTLNSASVVTTGFNLYSCTFTSTSTNITAINIVSTDAATQHTFYVDSAQLVTGATATPYGNGSLYIGGVLANPTTFQASANSTTALQVANASGSDIFTVDTLNGQVIIGNGSNTITLNPTSGGVALAGNARHTTKIILTPEYVGAVLDGTNADCSSNNVGTMVSGWDDTRHESYYKWATGQSGTECYDIIISMALPSDFSAFSGSNDIKIDLIDQNASSSNNSITATLKNVTQSNATDGSCNGSSALTTSTTWTSDQTTCNASTSGYAANDVISLRLKMSVANSSYWTQIGNITLTYLSSY